MSECIIMLISTEDSKVVTISSENVAQVLAENKYMQIMIRCSTQQLLEFILDVEQRALILAMKKQA